MTSKKTRDAAKEVFLPKVHKETVPSKVVREISSSLL